ncbi:DUF5071 domain-containing protein [Clostridium prolinivorans]|uniref:DUF5071 domain-containing protein n=1 Tax=Clostridium prolinivorans TaxID=2769420 RepID=UPI001D18AF85|nr:DUF5071 domain-containing protein [Clostridium prolinivorans]
MKNLLSIKLFHYYEIQPIIFELLEWLQNYNWPIAKEILPIVVLHQNIVMPHILTILQANDIMWKYRISNSIFDISKQASG